MYRISSRLSSRLSTTRFMPMAAHSCTPGREWMVIWVEPWIGMWGAIWRHSCTTPKSWTIKASILYWAAWRMSSAASFISRSETRVFRVRCTSTPRTWQYFTASTRVWGVKFLALWRAFRFPTPRYTALAPFCTAARRASMEPAGDSNSSIVFSPFKGLHTSASYNCPQYTTNAGKLPPLPGRIQEKFKGCSDLFPPKMHKKRKQTEICFLFLVISPSRD